MSLSTRFLYVVSFGIRAIFTTASPLTYNRIEPNTQGCVITSSTYFECARGKGVLSDGDIGPTDSVNISDPNQVTRFFVWHRHNGSVALYFTGDLSHVSYIDVYMLNINSAKIGGPAFTTFTTNRNPEVTIRVTPQSCFFSSSANALSRNIFVLPQDRNELIVKFYLSTDWLFISELKVCAGDVPSSVSCDSSSTQPTKETPNNSPVPSAVPPSLPLSSPPATGVTVTPDLGQPESVSLTCSVASPPTDDYQYQWQWWRNGTLLSNTDNRFSITQSTNTQSSSLVISGLRYSDAGDYMCTLDYGQCPVGVDCSKTTPVIGNIYLNLPGNYLQHYLDTDSSITFLSCDI